MGFEPWSWAGSYVLKMAGKALEERFAPDVKDKLVKAVKTWAAGLPPGFSVAPHALMPKLDEDDSAAGPAVRSLRETLAEQHVPSAQVWGQALEESRRAVGARFAPGEAEPFFQADDGSVAHHVKELAEQLHRVCKQDEKLFRATVHDAVVETRTADFLAEIQAAAQYTNDGKPDVTITLLGKIRQSRWRSLTVDEQFRLLADLGRAYEKKGEFREAANTYLAAKEALPTDEKARALEAVAYSYLGQRQQACDLAAAVLRDHPTCSIAAAVWVRTAPENTPAAEIDRRVHVAVKDAPDVLFTMAWRAVSNGDAAAGERLARLALKSKPGQPELKDLLGSAIIAAEAGVANAGGKPDAARLAEAVALLSDAVGKTHPQAELARIRQSRAVAYELQGLPAKAEADYRASIEGSPEQPDYVHRFIHYLLRRGRSDQAIDQLEESTQGGNYPSLSVPLANLLAERNRPGDRARAVDLLRSAIPKAEAEDEDTRESLVATLAQVHCVEREHGKALAVIDELPAGYVAETVRLVVLADVYRRAGRSADAAETAGRALDSLSSDASVNDRLRVADLLSAVGEHAKALPIWKQLLRPTRVDPFTHKALWSATKCEADGYVLDFCEQLRANGVEDPRCLELEVTLALRYSHFQRAIGIIQSYLKKAADGDLTRVFRTNLSLVGLRLNRPELVEADPNKLPPASTAPFQIGAGVAQVLRHGRNPDAGVRYAYELLRGHFSNADAHWLYMSTLGRDGEMTSAFPAPGQAVVGCAVHYREDDSGKEQWRIIEDSPDPKIERDEIGPDDALAKELMGKAAGDRFLLRPDPLQPRTGTVLEIMSKYEFRRIDVLLRGEERFGDKFPARTYTLPTGTGGAPDLEILFRSHDIHEAHTRLLREQYLQHPMSVTTFAELADVGILESLQHLASDGRLPVRCCLGNDQEWSAADAALVTAKKLVIDPFALATLFYSGRIEDLAQLPVRCVVLESTLEEYRSHIRRLSRTPAGFTGKLRGQYYFVKGDEGATASARQNATQFLTRLATLADIETSDRLADLDPNVRRTLLKLFGGPAAECIGYAAKEEAVLWSDDLAVAELARLELGVKRTWTQQLFMHCLSQGKVSEATFIDLTLFLLAWNYHFTRVYVVVALEAGTRTSWDPRREPLTSLIRSMCHPDVIAEQLLGLCAQLLPAVYRKAHLAHQRDDVTRALVHALLKRSDGPSLGASLARNADGIFGLDVASAACFRKIVVNIMQGWVGSW